MARAFSLVVGLAVPLVASGVARAQSGGLTLRPATGLEALSKRVARAWQRRTGDRARVLDPPPGGVPEAVAPGQVALVVEGEGLRVVLGGKAAHFHGADLPLEAPYDSGDVRAIVLAVESLRDAARAVSTPRSERGAASPSALLPPGRRRELPHVRPPPRQTAKPTVYARVLFGVSTVHGSPLLGPGAGFGLCVAEHCLVIEGELSLLPRTTTSQTGVRVRYRSVNAGFRVQLRPWVFEDSSLGFTFGPMTRIGQAIVGSSSVTVTNMGVRMALEGAYRLSRLVEIVIEGGVDLAVTRARIVRGGYPIFLEDRWTPWLVASVRMRP